MKSLSKIFNAIYLCIRFPFLYPRNRFSDKHTVYIRWMSNLVYKYYSKSYYDISLAYKFYKDPSCSQVMDVIQKMYKDNKQTISECSVDRVDQLNTLNEENAFLESYLPQPLTKEELTALISSQLTAGNNMSKIMKYLSEEYKGRYDGKVAVEIIKSLQ